MRVASRRPRAARRALVSVVLAATALSAPTAAADPGARLAGARDGGPSRSGHVRAPGAGPADLPAGVDGDSRAARWVPGEVIVKYRPGLSSSARATTRSAVGAALQERLRGRALEVLEVRGGVPGAVRTLERRPEVLYAQPNFVYRATATPNDPRFAEQWAARNTGQNVWGQAGIAGADIDAPSAWEQTTGDAAVKVAVVDTGIAYDHPDLAGNIWSNTGEALNGIDDDRNGYVDDVHGWDWVGHDNDPRDLSSHGTHVAGTIGAVGNNGRGVAGVAWHVSLMPLRVLDGAGYGNTADIVAAVDYAVAEGADVVNLSLGGADYDQTMSDAIARAPQTMFVVAAGNEHSDNDVTPDYPCDYPPANLVCVAATDNRDRLADFSNYGATSVDLGAPGVGILSAVPSKATMRSEGFNTSTWATRWVTGGTRDWGREVDSSSGPFISDSPGGRYAAKANTWLRTSTPIDLSGRYGCRVDYWMWLDTQAQHDWLRVETSTDRKHWTQVAGWTGSTEGYWYPFSDYLDDGGRSLYLRFRLTSDGWGQGDGAGIDDVDVNCFGAPYSGDEYDSYDGTSMATPQVTGAAALLFAAQPGATVQAVRDALLGGAEPLASLAGKTVTGARLNLKSSLDALAGNPPYVAFEQGSYTVDETDTQATVTVTRSGDTSGAVGVDYTAAAGTATAATDFVPTTGTLSFDPHQTTASFTVDLLPDEVPETDETISLALSSPTGGAVLGRRETSTLRVEDDDFSVLTFTPATRTVAENAGTAYLTVTREGRTSLPASVSFARTGGSATPGADLSVTPGTLDFAPGQTNLTIPVTVLDDTTREAAETVRVALTPLDPGTVLGSPSTSTLTIAPSDQRPDAWISTGSSSGYVGNNVYNTTGSNQTKTLTARRGATRTFYARVYNDGNVTNVFTLQGTPAASGSRVRYLSGGTDVTSAMRSSAGYRVKLGAGAYRLIKVQTTILSTARIGSLQRARVTGTWIGDGTRTDVAGSVVKVVR